MKALTCWHHGDNCSHWKKNFNANVHFWTLVVRSFHESAGPRIIPTLSKNGVDSVWNILISNKYTWLLFTHPCMVRWCRKNPYLGYNDKTTCVLTTKENAVFAPVCAGKAETTWACRKVKNLMKTELLCVLCVLLPWQATSSLTMHKTMSWCELKMHNWMFQNATRRVGRKSDWHKVNPETLQFLWREWSFFSPQCEHLWCHWITCSECIFQL